MSYHRITYVRDDATAYTDEHRAPILAALATFEKQETPQ